MSKSEPNQNNGNYEVKETKQLLLIMAMLMAIATAIAMYAMGCMRGIACTSIGKSIKGDSRAHHTMNMSKQLC